MKKKYLLLTASVIVILAGIITIMYVKNHPSVKSINLENESLTGIYLMQQVDKTLLEKELGKLTNDNIDNSGKSTLLFDNPPYYASVQADKNNQVTEIFVGYPNKISNTKFTTSRGISSQSSFSDVVKVYGNNY